jgi:hypothetical protein
MYDFNLEILAKEAANVFDCPPYDTILSVAKMLFGYENVTYNERMIFIRDKINLQLCLSWNEQKVYFRTYFNIDTPTGERTEDTSDFNNELDRINQTFRLFNVEQMVAYLQLKEIENRFIRNNEG